MEIVTALCKDITALKYRTSTVIVNIAKNLICGGTDEVD